MRNAFLELIYAAVGGLIGGWFVFLFRSRSRRRNSELLASGQRSKLVASVRRVESGIRGRWRHGAVLTNSAGSLWRPRPSRVGAKVDLDGAVLTEVRRPAGKEFWWVNPDAVVFGLALPSGLHEIAVVPEDERRLREVLAR